MPQEREPVETRRRSSGVFSLQLLLSPQLLLTCLRGSPRPILSNPVCLENLNKQVVGSHFLMAAGMRVALKDVLDFEAFLLASCLQMI